jgi:UTP--glucose-1-phosphate uridylyltransferase
LKVLIELGGTDVQVKKAIIPAAGLGTRFLPATKAQPKEMLPIVDKPTIQFIIEEAIHSGIEDIIVVTGRGKRAIEDHFDKSFELEETLKSKKKYRLLKDIEEISNMTNIHYIRQKEAKGLGHAIWCARKFVGKEPFAVLLGDDIVQSETPCLQQLMEVFNKFQQPVVGVQEVEEDEVSKYGIISPKSSDLESNIIEVETLIEKPSREESPSKYAIMGRYILTPEIFDILDKTPSGAGDEIQLTDAIKELNKMQSVLAYNFQGKRYDIGDKIGFIKATIDFALQREDLSNDVLDYIKKIYESKYINS